MPVWAGVESIQEIERQIREWHPEWDAERVKAEAKIDQNEQYEIARRKWREE